MVLFVDFLLSVDRGCGTRLLKNSGASAVPTESSPVCQDSAGTSSSGGGMMKLEVVGLGSSICEGCDGKGDLL